jgi:fatty acid-binding protein DegV
MGIKIVADRMIDLPKEELAALNIDTISCYINMGDKSYSDLDDIFPDDVFKFMDESGHVAKTAAKSPVLYSEFESVYNRMTM